MVRSRSSVLLDKSQPDFRRGERLRFRTWRPRGWAEEDGAVDGARGVREVRVREERGECWELGRGHFVVKCSGG